MASVTKVVLSRMVRVMTVVTAVAKVCCRVHVRFTEPNVCQVPAPVVPLVRVPLVRTASTSQSVANPFVNHVPPVLVPEVINDPSSV